MNNKELYEAQNLVIESYKTRKSGSKDYSIEESKLLTKDLIENAKK